MEIQRFNRVTFPKERFPSKTALWASVGALLQVLDDTENICVVWDDGEYVYVDFNPSDPALEHAKPYWLFDDEFEEIDEIDDIDSDGDNEISC